ncbi:MAG: peptidylprolyl isomerase [Proteobacteria bacterium]|nr:peptidylprolyl isomerase [Pseudomonadota bacterium]
MSKAKTGDRVKVHYTGRMENGTEFETSKETAPREFAIGSGFYFAGFEEAIIGLRIGDTKKVTLPPEKAYGPWFEELTVRVKKSDIPEDINPVVGEKFKVWRPDGNLMPLTITEITENIVTLDANHPLAGKTLIYDIELIDII